MDLKNYRCTVTLLVEDVSEDTIGTFMHVGEEVEWARPDVPGILASIEDVERVEEATGVL